MRETILYGLPRVLSRCSQVLVAVMVRLHHSVAADIRWTLFYILILGATYLFHSPFRSHNGAALDGYGRATKVMQTWLMITMVCFHIAPRVVRQKREQLEKYAETATHGGTTSEKGLIAGFSDADVSFAGVVFFPMFVFMTCLFLFLHKMKRRWHMVITYGSSLTMVLMNSLLMAALCIMHHTFSRRLFYVEEVVSPKVLASPLARDEDGKRNLWTVSTGLYSFFLHHVVRWVLITPSMAHKPFQVMFRLQLLCCTFIVCDYFYKRRQGGDPSRGILWADLYDYQKQGSYYKKKAEEGRRERGFLGWKLWWRFLLPVAPQMKADLSDWRDVEPKPRSFDKKKKKPAQHPHRRTDQSPSQSPSQSTNQSPNTKQLEGLGGSGSAKDPAITPTAASDAAEHEQGPNHAHPHPHTNRRHAPNRFDDAPLMYNDPSVDLNMTGCAGSDDETRTNASAAGAGSPNQRGPGGSGGLGRILFPNGPAPASARSLTKTVVSFKEKRSFIKDVSEGQHPINKPGMVPWWSTFSIMTAWQSAVNSTLKFMSFDVRTIQNSVSPKVFALHFFPSIKHIYDPDRGHPVWGQDLYSSTTYEPSQLGATSTTSARNAGSGGNGDSPPVDVWFDWIADVGDGFNPTYEMGRLLAQPLLRANVAGTSKREVFGENYLADKGNDLMKESLACETLPASIFDDDDGGANDGMGSHSRHTRQATPRMAASAPLAPQPLPHHGTAGTKRAAADATADAAQVTAEELEAAATVPRATQSEPSSPVGETALPAKLAIGRSASAGHLSARALAPPADAIHTAAGLMPDRGAYTPDSVPRASAFATATGALSYEVLPRGSFVLVGGDLAYPTPTDETYGTRLFDPYEDALPGSHRLKQLFHAQQRNVVAPDPFDEDMAHISMIDAATAAMRVVRGGGSMLFGKPPDERGSASARTSDDDDDDEEGNTGEKEKKAATKRGGNLSLEARATAAEALHTIPMLFSIPGNHDWFDGLTTFRKWIIEKTWIGGWLMPQRSSFFVLKLPYNWFILCMDTGNDQDINTAQRNYFLRAIEKYMNDETCVVLVCHEPGWLFNAMNHRSSPLQPEIDAVVRQLGTRMRLRIAGDIHHYSRHVPVDPLSEAATLIVSGGGGAYLYGARDDMIIEQGTRYFRAGAFPRKNTFMSIASRLWGFRVVNWKFDIIIGVCCFGMIYSILPVPFSEVTKLFELCEQYRQDDIAAHGGDRDEDIVGLSRFVFVLFALTAKLWGYLMNNGIISFVPIGMFYMCFNSAGADRNASTALRALYGAFWTGCCVWCCCCAVSLLYVVMNLLHHHGMIASSRTHWDSFLDHELRATTDDFWTHARLVLGDKSVLSLMIAAVQQYFYGSGQWIVHLVSFIARALDPIETLYYLSLHVTADPEQFGVFSPKATRLQVGAYYLYILFFYWILVTPIVSFIIGLFLVISTTAFDFMYDGSYSAFQIEDFKHFLRFRIDHTTRKLHCYVVAEKKVPKVWELNRTHVEEMKSGERRNLPPHMRFHPSRWIPSLTYREKAARSGAGDGGAQTSHRASRQPATANVLEHFVINPHRTGNARSPATRSL